MLPVRAARAREMCSENKVHHLPKWGGEKLKRGGARGNSATGIGAETPRVRAERSRRIN